MFETGFHMMWKLVVDDSSTLFPAKRIYAVNLRLRCQKAMLPLLALMTLMALLTSSCTIAPLRSIFTENSADKPGKLESRNQFLEQELRRKQKLIDELKERNLVLEKRVKGGAEKPEVPPVLQWGADDFRGTAYSEGGLAQKASEPARSDLRASPQQSKNVGSPKTRGEAIFAPPELAVDDAKQTGEQRLYSKVLEAYRLHNFADTQKATNLLIKTFPDSVHADNALYILGLLAFESRDFEKATFYMERLLREYPTGNKIAAALFAKAMIEKMVGRMGEANVILKAVRERYPGSPEAIRAAIESRVIEQMNRDPESKPEMVIRREG